MRWAGQEVVEDGVGADLALPGMRGLLRSVRPPEFAGMVFHEVEARSALNKVTGGSSMPFRWTINPYRGCSHACTYCMVGETPVLLYDGKTRALADLSVGDEIYGTEWHGSSRRYVRTTVLAHWSTVKPAYRVTLADGTVLVTSGDHRVLTEGGWKHVVNQVDGARPSLATGNSLLGTGRFAVPRPVTGSYRRGYLTGMIRSDSHLGSYSYNRPGHAPGDVHRFRLAVADVEALGRSRSYLAAHAVPTEKVELAVGTGSRRFMTAIRNPSARGAGAVREIIRWPTDPDAEWTRGFLAGMFDAQGSYARGVLRISNADPVVLGWTGEAFRRLGFRWIQDRRRPNGVCDVRLRGGQVERMRFFHTVDPAITRKRAPRVATGWCPR